MTNDDKLQQMVDVEGYKNLDEMLYCEIENDLIGPMPGILGICMNETCDYTTRVEPDQDEGWCEICGTQTVKSLYILFGVI